MEHGCLTDPFPTTSTWFPLAPQASGRLIESSTWGFENMESGDAHCAGVEGILAAYRKAIRTVSLATPTNFAPIISAVSSHAARQTDGRHYHVLLIITGSPPLYTSYPSPLMN